MSCVQRLLVVQFGPVIDPHLIRYASMLVRLKTTVPREARGSSPQTDSLGRVLAVKRPARARRRLVNEWSSAAKSSDSEVRFLAILPRGEGEDGASAVRSGRLALRTQVDTHFRPPVETAKVGCDALQGQTAGRVLAYANDFGSDLLLVGRIGMSERSVTRLAVASNCSTWFVPTGWAPVLRRILVPIDFSPQAAGSVQAAVDLARRYAPAKCLLLHVDRQETRCGGDEIAPVRRRELMSKLDGLVRRIDTHGVRVAQLLVKGQHVERAIARAANEQSTDLIVMATRGRTRIAGGLLPSSTAATMREFQGAVLALKAENASLGWRDAVRQRWQQVEDSHFS